MGLTLEMFILGFKVDPIVKTRFSVELVCFNRFVMASERRSTIIYQLL